jgi:hypothetical protein
MPGNSVIAAATTGLWGTYTTPPGSITAGTTYGFWVVAINYIGVGTPSNKVSALAS